MSRNAPPLGDEMELLDEPATGPRPSPPRRGRSRQQRDVLTVGVLTPALLLGLLLGLLVLGNTFYPDTYVAPTATATVAARLAGPTATPVVVVQPIDTAVLNAGLVDRPPAFEWPEVDGMKLQADPGRPSEHADYTAELADVETRRYLSAVSVNLATHNTAAFAEGATTELVKAYPVRPTSQRLVDLRALTGYLVDDSTFGVIFSYGATRVQIEAVAASPPIRPEQRALIEYAALHVGEHVLRRMQEIASGGRRTVPEATAVHWRDHLARRLPFG
jgi:hypothetical protein